MARASVATAAPRLSADAGELPGTGTLAGSRGREPSPTTLHTPGARGFPCSLSLGPAQTCRSEKLGVRWDGGRAGRVAVSDSQPGRGHSSAETRVAARWVPGALAGSPEHRVALVPPALQPRGGSLCSSVPGRLPPGPVQGHLGPGAGGDRARGGTSTRTADGEAGDRVPRRPSLAPAARVTREELAASCRRVRGSPSQWGVSPTSVSGVRFGASAGQGPWGDADGVASWGGRARTSEPSSEVRLALHARAAQRGAWPPAARPPPLPPQPPRPEGRLPVVVLDAPGCRASPGGFQPGCLPRAFTLSLLCTPPPPRPPGW